MLNFLVSLAQLAYDLFVLPGVVILIVALGAAVWALYQFGGDLFHCCCSAIWRRTGKSCTGPKSKFTA